MMNPEIKSKWVAALRSGEYKQGIDVLHNPEKNTYCCLGVLCDIAVKSGLDLHVERDEFADAINYDGAIYYLPTTVVMWANISSHNPVIGGGRSLAKLNDSGHSFLEIADEIEAGL